MFCELLNGGLLAMEPTKTTGNSRIIIITNADFIFIFYIAMQLQATVPTLIW